MTKQSVAETTSTLQDLDRDHFQIVVVQAAATMECPEFNGRLQRAMDLVLTDSVRVHQDGTATVKSGSHTYEIAPDCTCQDSRQRSRYCKHYLAVELLKRTYLCLNSPQPASNGHQPEPQPQTAESSQDDNRCPIHNVPMKRYRKGNQSWLSHQLPDGSWCRGK